MNIAIFPSAFYPSLGGVEELVRQLAHQLKRDGHRVMIATNRWPKSIPQRENIDGLDVNRYVCRVPERTWRQMGGALLFGPGTLRSVCADLRSFDAQIVHIQCVSSSAYYAVNAARRLKLPLVATLQGELTMDASRIFQTSRFAQGLMRNVLSKADVVTGCSEHTLAEGAAFYGKPFGGRGRAVPNGVLCSDFETPPFRHERPYIFAIGRHAPQKGFDNLIRAFARIVLDPRGAELHDLLIAGDGPESETLKQISKELCLGDRVTFVGRKSHQEAVELFLGCSFFVLSSRADEGLPVVTVEALAAGAPIVATRSGGAPEAIQDGVNGLIVPKDNVDALEEAMRRMASDPVMRAGMRAANASRARLYDWANIAQQYVNVYERAIERHKAAGK